MRSYEDDSAVSTAAAADGGRRLLANAQPFEPSPGSRLHAVEIDLFLADFEAVSVAAPGYQAKPAFLGYAKRGSILDRT
ncbi:hypothetical protein [Burkholderia sp. D-99]|uniref:hypothetical protein n=1 Tax=Burkholderia sp. D-99 TaxID=2717316 RepID=UPI0014246D2D|nr:hypothetical protein [Burkholderia sp. D-99]NHV28328.1 hypothetical protein [Burkholderia sp. D-99]